MSFKETKCCDLFEDLPFLWEYCKNYDRDATVENRNERSLSMILTILETYTHTLSQDKKAGKLG